MKTLKKATSCYRPLYYNDTVEIKHYIFYNNGKIILNYNKSILESYNLKKRYISDIIEIYANFERVRKINLNRIDNYIIGDTAYIYINDITNIKKMIKFDFKANDKLYFKKLIKINLNICNGKQELLNDFWLSFDVLIRKTNNRKNIEKFTQYLKDNTNINLTYSEATQLLKKYEVTLK